MSATAGADTKAGSPMKIIRNRPKSVDIDEFLSRPLFGHLATVSVEGPRESPIWFLWEDGAVWIIGNSRADTFVHRIEHDPRCATGIVDFEPSEGRVEHAGFRGRATVEPFSKERAKRLLRRYLGDDERSWDAARFLNALDDPDNVLIRFLPDTAVARDQSYRVAGTSPEGS